MGNIKKIKSVKNLLSGIRLNGEPGSYVRKPQTQKDKLIDPMTWQKEIDKKAAEAKKDKLATVEGQLIGGDYKRKTDGARITGESTGKIKKDPKGIEYVETTEYGPDLPKGDTIHLRNISPLNSNGEPGSGVRASQTQKDKLTDPMAWEKETKAKQQAKEAKEKAKAKVETEAKKKKLAADTKKKKEAEENKLEKVETKGPDTTVDNKTETMSNQRLKEAVDRAHAPENLFTGKESRRKARKIMEEAGMTEEEKTKRDDLKKARKTKAAQIIGAALSAAGGGEYWKQAGDAQATAQKIKDLKAKEDVDETSSDAEITNQNAATDNLMSKSSTVKNWVSTNKGLTDALSPYSQKRKKRKKKK